MTVCLTAPRGVPFLLACVVATTACGATSSGRSRDARADLPDTAAIVADVRYLASDALEGRATGTPGNDSAAAYISRRFERIGLTPLTSSGNGRFLQPFVARSVAAAHAGLPSAMPTQNVVGMVRGTDPALRDEYVIVGAHFDHLGRTAMGALDPDAKNAIRNGADDNASGTAAVLELARLLRRHPPKRSVIFVTFSGEELGLLGSQHFVDSLPVPVDKVRAMLNFDMVGRLRDNRLIVYGVATATEWNDIIGRANTPPNPLEITGTGDGFGASDHSSFYAKNLPVLHFFTNVHDDYHKATDDADKVNNEGIARVVALAERVARDVADRPGPLTFVRAVATAPTSSSRAGTSAYLGSIPDMGATEVAGVRLSGVRAESPADKAGLKAGDIIIELGGKPVKDLYAYTDALYAHQPGDTVDIVVMRGAERITVKATLGKRGS